MSEGVSLVKCRELLALAQPQGPRCAEYRRGVPDDSRRVGSGAPRDGALGRRGGAPS